MLFTDHGLPYPSGSDPVQQGDDTFLALVTALDPDAPTSPIPSLVAASGWSLTSSTLLQLGPLCFAVIVVSKTGSGVGTGDSSGQLTDSQAVTGVPAAYRPTSTMPMNIRVGTSPNLVQAWGELRADGSLWMTNGLPGTTYSTGTHTFSGFWMLGI